VTAAELPELALARGTLDRASGHRGDPQWLADRWADRRTRVYPVAPHHGLAAGPEDAPTLVTVAVASVEQYERYLLGVDGDDVACFAVQLPDAEALQTVVPDARVVTLREVGGQVSATEAGVLVHAIALANWHDAHPNCARCGASTAVALAGAERRCASCGATHFPRTDPAVIMTVTSPDGRLLLGRQAAWPPGRYSTLAGFVEPGESAERAVVREVLEESGIAVTDVRYLGSQPWPFPASLMLGFAARSHDAHDPHPDGEELADARWFTVDEVRAAIAAEDARRSTAVDGVEVVVEVVDEVPPLRLPPRLSIARHLIEHWLHAAGPT
jgi:NAD+ diphosphatase